MVKISEETIIQTKAENVWNFLTTLHEGDNYKKWHPTDHIKFVCLKGDEETVGSQLYFEEHIGKSILKLSYQISVSEKNRYLEYRATFPFSLFHLGKGSFRITKLGNGEVKMTAYIEYGYDLALIGNLIDKIVDLFFKRKSLEKHVQEEGENIKKILENHKD